MDMITVAGYAGALLVGLVLGVLGGGGSILTVPIMVYVIGLHPVLGTAYSLFVVGSTSLFGTVKNLKNKTVDFKTALIFAIPSLFSVFLMRRYVIPAIPEELFEVSGFMVTKSVAIMMVFAIVMLAAAIAMIRSGVSKIDGRDDLEPNFIRLGIQGFATGLLTGFVGAGGGFLIVPALVLIAGLSMKRAVATSLFIISVNSLLGFTGDIQNLDIDWLFLLSFSGLSIIGIFIGIWLNKFFDGRKLKSVFGYFVLLMGIYVCYKELFM
ncbi:sulfite exporter TauE/SafE family protein [Nonlabens xiamenensis]|uniref:sulfite exporter TauE/SafE family protein n=1 Tax=Nonlabens xiamenensis TaxID=2341043 RepID=UPI000F60CEB8|nr:sulfite exporter TauE/SafE family protein [Nonlabens xiamenensis]